MSVGGWIIFAIVSTFIMCWLGDKSMKKEIAQKKAKEIQSQKSIKEQWIDHAQSLEEQLKLAKEMIYNLELQEPLNCPEVRRCSRKRR